MAEIIWTEMAIDDLNNIAEYISKDSQYYAKDFIQRIINKIETITLFPKMGRKVPEQNDEDIREILYHNYRLIYKIDIEKIYIVIVSHGSFDLEERFDTI